jgi:hypothetical protein
MAHIDEAFRIDTLSLNDNVLITEGQIDPSTGAGYEAPVGSLFLNSVNSFIYHKYGTADTDWNRFGEIDAATVFAALKAPTGFISRSDSIISFNDTSRVFAIDILSPATSYVYYIKGTKHTILAQKTITIPNVSGLYYIYFDGNETLQLQTTFSDTIFTDNAIVSILYWNAISAQSVYFADERHGVVMDSATHSYLHSSLGTRFISGFALGGTINPPGDLPQDLQFNVANGIIRDEDLVHSIVDIGLEVDVFDLQQELSPIAQIPVLYRLGSAGEWYEKTADSFAFIYNGTAGYSSTRMPFNEWTGSTWQLTELANNHYGLIHIFATNDIRHPIIAIQGITEYQNKPAGVDAALIELRQLSNLPFAEFFPIATLIFQTTNSITNTQKMHWLTTDSGALYVDWRYINNVSMTNTGISDHGSLSGLLDDDHTQYALAGAGSTRTFNFGDLINISDISHVSVDNGNLYGMYWDNPTLKYKVNTVYLHNMFDVNVTNSAGIDGYGLQYDNATGKWIASPVAPILKLYSENPSAQTSPVAIGINSVAIGNGAQTDTSAPDSIALGSQSLARIRGGVVQANGRFGSTGDAQVGRYLLRTHTVNSAATEMFVDGTGGSTRLTLPDNSTWHFTATVTGHRTDAGDGHAGYKVEGVIYRNSGANTIAIQGSVIKSVIAESNPSWDINIVADTTNGSLKINVTGQAGKTVRWVALIDTVEITN